MGVCGTVRRREGCAGGPADVDAGDSDGGRSGGGDVGVDGAGAGAGDGAGAGVKSPVKPSTKVKLFVRVRYWKSRPYMCVDAVLFSASDLSDLLSLVCLTACICLCGRSRSRNWSCRSRLGTGQHRPAPRHTSSCNPRLVRRDPEKDKRTKEKTAEV